MAPVMHPHIWHEAQIGQAMNMPPIAQVALASIPAPHSIADRNGTAISPITHIAIIPVPPDPPI